VQSLITFLDPDNSEALLLTADRWFRGLMNAIATLQEKP
jgi:hypothetical protein